MSKLLMIILLVSSLFVVGLSIVTVLLHQNSTGFQSSLHTAPTPTITTLHAISLVPQSQTVLPGQTNIVNILLETQNKNVNAPQLVQLEIAYDPNALLDVTMTPGGFFDKPTELLKIINTNTGRISYALSSNTKTENPIVARLTFVPNPVFSGSETAISFLGKTTIRGATDDTSITATYATKLFFASGSATVQNNPILPITQ